MKTKSKWILLGSTALLCNALTGCVTPNMPPPMTMSKFVRDPGEDPGRGRVGFSTGAAFLKASNASEGATDDESSTIFSLFPVEGSVSGWLADRYDLSFSVHSTGLGALEGNFAFLDTGNVRLGLVHGLGLGLHHEMEGCGESCEGLLSYLLSAGLMAQFNGSSDGAFFVSAKYAYSGYEPLGGGENGSDTYTHFISGSLGYMARVGGLRIIPELVVSYGAQTHSYESAGMPAETYKSNIWYIIPTLTFAAAY